MTRPTLGLGAFGMWDAGGGGMGNANRKIVGPNAQHYRAPSYLTLGNNTVTGSEESQATMDAIIKDCYVKGVDYFIIIGISFDPYAPLTGSMGGHTGDNNWGGFNLFLKYYLTSPYKSLVPYCLSLGPGGLGRDPYFNGFGSNAGTDPADWANQRDWIVTRMRDSNYFTVNVTSVGGTAHQPLFYWLNPTLTQNESYASSASAFKADLDDLVTHVTTVGLDHPYMVAWGDFNGTTYGWQAKGNYALFGVSVSGEAYSSYANRVENFNSAMASSYSVHLPNAEIGHDWNDIYNSGGLVSSYVLPGDTGNQANNPDTNWVVKPTPTEVANHVQRVFNYVTSHVSSCPHQTVSFYSLTEFCEGTTGLDETYRTALSSILGTRSIVKSLNSIYPFSLGGLHV